MTVDYPNEITYLRSFIKAPFEGIDRIEKSNALRNDVQPQVEPEIGKFLEFMVVATGAKRVLELGTSNGSSALWIISGLRRTKGRLITIDSKERLYNEAIQNFKLADSLDIVTPILGDAKEEVEKLEPGFDLVFQDCGKYLYPKLFERLIFLTRQKGLIIADDTLFKVNSKVRPNLGKFTDKYNRLAFESDKLISTILPIGSGLTASIKL